MKIILLKDISKVGRKGEIKEVSDGFAKNMLIAKGLATTASKEAENKVAKSVKEKSEQQQKQLSKLESNKKELERRTFTISVKVGDKGQIFSGVHEKDIIQAIFQKTKISLEKPQVVLDQNIKTLGDSHALIKLGSGITAKIRLNVEAIN